MGIERTSRWTVANRLRCRNPVVESAPAVGSPHTSTGVPGAVARHCDTRGDHARSYRLALRRATDGTPLPTRDCPGMRLDRERHCRYPRRSRCHRRSRPRPHPFRRRFPRRCNAGDANSELRITNYAPRITHHASCFLPLYRRRPAHHTPEPGIPARDQPGIGR